MKKKIKGKKEGGGWGVSDEIYKKPSPYKKER